MNILTFLKINIPFSYFYSIGLGLMTMIRFIKNWTLITLFYLTLNAFSLNFMHSFGSQYEHLNSILPSTPASPTVSSLGKYGAWPVSYYRGTPDISITLGNYQVGAFNMPVSLSYHASGIKVEDIASWVGLGWSLNAGGVINISVKGVSDFIFEDPFGNPKPRTIKSKQDIVNLDFFSQSDFDKINAKSLDSEPDVYNYNFSGYSGQFVIDSNNEVVFLKNNNGLTITLDIPNRKIEAKDLVGNIYLFEQYEYTISEHSARSYNAANNTSLPSNIFIDDLEQITAFFLTEIILKNNIGSIFFEYEDETSTHYTKFNGTMNTTASGGEMPCNAHFPWTNHPMFWHEENQHTFIRYKVTNHSKRLKSISNSINNNKILFFANHNRQDVLQQKGLSRIEFINNNYGTASIYWDFQYEYFISPVHMLDDLGNKLHKRLKLKAIQKYGYNGITSESEHPYTFFYYGETEPDLNMPYRTSFDGEDYWGYNNSDARYVSHNDFKKIFQQVRHDNVGLFKFISAHEMYYNDPDPTMFMTLFPLMPSFNGGNKTPDGYFAKALTLKEINYPTGGKTLFEFEGHIYSVVNNDSSYEPQECGGIRIKKITDIADDGNFIIRNFTYGTGVINMLPNPVSAFPKNCVPLTGNPNNPYGIPYTGIIVGPAGTPLGFVNSQAWLWGYKLSSSLINPVYSYNSDYIGYKQVTETIEGSGRTEYYYTSANDLSFTNRYSYQAGYASFGGFDLRLAGYINSQIPVYPFNSYITGPIYSRGLLTKIYKYNESGKRIYEELLEYDNIEGLTVYGNQVYKTNMYSVMDNNIIIDYKYYLNAYEIQTGKSLLISKTTIHYDDIGQNQITTITLHSHDMITELLTEVSQSFNDNEQKTITTIYPFDYIEYSAPISQMVSQHMLNYPIETITTVNGLVA